MFVFPKMNSADNLPKKILIVDDDGDDRLTCSDVAMEVNDDINCLTANNGVEVLDLLETISSKLPDFIFLNLNMPI